MLMMQNQIGMIEVWVLIEMINAFNMKGRSVAFNALDDIAFF
jgi:hypothetical protein